MSDEREPEMDRMRADHDRFMQLLARLPEPSEADKRAFAEANSPEGWQKAFAAVVADTRPRPGKGRYWLLAGTLVAAAVAAALVIFGII